MNNDSHNQPAVGLAIGSKVGKYEVRERLGIGGQAIVYKAYDALLDRHVAIKQISSHLAEDPKFLERFRREAQILARLGAEQPAIVTIHELIQDERGLFIVMEFVAGHTLEATLQDNPGPVEPKAVLAILWRLAAGLHAVHSAGIIHRDIKPANIIIGEGLKAKITDFGVAATASGQTSMVMGTTKYMAPELYGEGPVDARADMYSLGFIAYELVLGRAKFNEIFADVVRDSHSERLRWMKWHGSDKVQAPALHEVNAEIPAALSDLVAKMMAKNPDERFESMEALGRAIKAGFSAKAQALREAAEAGALRKHRRHRHRHSQGADAASDVGLSDGGPENIGPSEPPATAALPKRPMSLRRKLLLIGSAVVIVVVTLSALIVHSSNQADLRQRQAHQKFVAATIAYGEAVKNNDDKGFAEAAGGYAELVGHYKELDEGAEASVLVHLARAQQAVVEAVKATGDKVRQDKWSLALSEQEAAVDHLKTVRLAKVNLGGWADRTSQDIDKFDLLRKSTRGFRTAMDEAETALKAGQFKRARDILSTRLATSEFQLTREQDAQLRDFQASIDLQEQVAAIATRRGAFKAAMDQGKFEQAAAELTAAGDALARIPEGPLKKQLKKQLEDDQARLSTLSVYDGAMVEAEQAIKSGDKPKALAAYQKAYKAQPSADLDDKIKSLQALMEYEKGMDFVKQNKFDEAKEAFELSLKFKDDKKVRDQLEAIDKTEHFTALMKIADDLFGQNDFKGALEKYRQAAAIDPTSAEVQAKIKECEFGQKMAQAKELGAQKKYDEAATVLEECRKLIPDKVPEVDACWNDLKQTRDYDEALALGNAAMKKKQWSKAREEFAKAGKIKPGKEVDDLVKESHYDEDLASGKELADQGHFVDARAYFMAAQRSKDTAEVRDLINQMNAKIPRENK